MNNMRSDYDEVVVLTKPEVTVTLTIKLTWPPNPASENVPTYQVFRATSSGAYNYTQPLATVPKTQVDGSGNVYYQEAGTGESDLYYVVRAVSSKGVASGNSNEVAALKPTAPPTPPVVSISVLPN